MFHGCWMRIWGKTTPNECLLRFRNSQANRLCPNAKRSFTRIENFYCGWCEYGTFCVSTGTTHSKILLWSFPLYLSAANETNCNNNNRKNSKNKKKSVNFANDRKNQLNENIGKIHFTLLIYSFSFLLKMVVAFLVFSKVKMALTN